MGAGLTEAEKQVMWMCDWLVEDGYTQAQYDRIVKALQELPTSPHHVVTYFLKISTREALANVTCAKKNVHVDEVCIMTDCGNLCNEKHCRAMKLAIARDVANENAAVESGEYYSGMML